MTETTTPPNLQKPPTPPEPPRAGHYAEALAALDRAQIPVGGVYSDPATIAAAHAQILLASEARVANLIAYLGVVTAPGARPPRGLVEDLERRIDAALGTAQPGGATDA